MSDLSALNQLNRDLKECGVRFPTLFVGHGSPMNAIEENEFHRSWGELGKHLPKPKAIVCVSAHWETEGTWVTAMPHPKTIHDFGGFPQKLFDAQYPAPGDPALAKETAALFTQTKVGLDEKWGLDHGAWSVLLPMFPLADIPVLQLSLDYTKSGPEHYALAAELAALRDKGVLILGSGNIVHNLRILNFGMRGAYDWATTFNENVKAKILSGDHAALANYEGLGAEARLAIPTPEHYLPMLYILALRGKNEPLSFFNDKPVAGSLTMTSFRIG